MKRTSKISTTIILIVILLLIGACTSSEPQIVEVTKIVNQTVEVEVTKIVDRTVEVEITRIVNQTVVATQLVTVVVTATPEPATATPTLQPTPEFQKWTSEQAIEAFKKKNLEAEETRSMTKDDYGLAPMVAVEGTRFLIPSLCATCGGRVMSFSTPGHLEAAKTYYDELGKNNALFFSWVFVKDNILVQINGDLPEEQARLYEAALEELK